MQNIIDFLLQLQQNNDRNWFKAHKSWYDEVSKEFDAFTEKLIAGIGRFDPTVKGLTVKDCTYRIYRDIRFSPDKSPYKTHMGAYICRGGKKSTFAGYYFHIEPGGNDSAGNNILSTGFYLPEPKVLKSIRDEVLDNGEKFITLVNQATGFELNRESRLKRVPTGYPADSPYADYLKLKDFYLDKAISNDFLLDADLLENTVREFQKTAPFLQFVNEAAEYAYYT